MNGFEREGGTLGFASLPLTIESAGQARGLTCGMPGAFRTNLTPSPAGGGRSPAKALSPSGERVGRGEHRSSGTPCCSHCPSPRPSPLKGRGSVLIRLLATLLLLLALLAPALPAAARDTLRIGLPLEPPNLDPTSGAANATDQVAYGTIFEGLVQLTADGTLRPMLATRWTVSGGGLVYTFDLRPNVRFHDGERFDARTVKFTLERAIAPDSTNAQRDLFEQILLEAHLDAGDWIEAQQMLELRRAHDPDDVPLNRKLAAVYAKLGLPEQAEQAAGRVRNRKTLSHQEGVG